MNWNNLRSCLLVALVIAFTACNNDDNDVSQLEITYNFAQSQHGWTGEFADYPVGEEDFYELDFAHAVLPAPLDTTQKALRLIGHNRSDDLYQSKRNLQIAQV